MSFKYERKHMSTYILIFKVTINESIMFLVLGYFNFSRKLLS